MAKTFYKKEDGLQATNQPVIRIYDSVAEAESHLDELEVGDVVGTKLIDDAVDMAAAQNLISDALSILQDKIPDDASATNQCITVDSVNTILEDYTTLDQLDSTIDNTLKNIIDLIDFIEPIGTIKLCNGNYDSEHWHECDGSEGTIDLREAVPVGIGTRDGLDTHDTYTIGEFKEDQLQGHTHVYYHPRNGGGKGGDGNNGGNSYTGAPATASGYGTVRVGTTTHGRQVGMVFIQKIKKYGE